MEFSVETIPGGIAAAFVETDVVFREDNDLLPRTVGQWQYMPWGAQDNMPYLILDKFEQDETLSVCAAFQSEVTYAAGIRYVTPPEAPEASEVRDFIIDNDIQSYFLGICRDLKMFEFAVSVIMLSPDGSRIEGIHRKEACYCRFAPADRYGKIPYLLYANFRRQVVDESNVEMIELLDARRLRADLRERAARGGRKFAVVTRIPGPDSIYYPIPAYGSIFRGKWYNIKRFIGIAKEAKLKNSAPIKYLIEISSRYWDDLFRARHITDSAAKLVEINRVKSELIDFLTGARNSGKAIFSNFYVSPEGKEVHDIKITKIEDDKEGGDWASDHQEAINMLCFAMRVHSNLVGSVPGKSQSNNSGSDKRELYTIAQALQSPYRNCALTLHRMIADFNGWRLTNVECPLLQLTTLDQHTDIREV